MFAAMVVLGFMVQNRECVGLIAELKSAKTDKARIVCLDKFAKLGSKSELALATICEQLLGSRPVKEAVIDSIKQINSDYHKPIREFALNHTFESFGVIVDKDLIYLMLPLIMKELQSNDMIFRTVLFDSANTLEGKMYNSLITKLPDNQIVISYIEKLAAYGHFRSINWLCEQALDDKVKTQKIVKLLTASMLKTGANLTAPFNLDPNSNGFAWEIKLKLTCIEQAIKIGDEAKSMLPTIKKFRFHSDKRVRDAVDAAIEALK